MIGLLRGKVIFKQPPELLLDVNGVGYEVLASMNTFYGLPLDQQTEVTLFTHLAVREDAQTLYGFSSQEERNLFRQLLKVNGVGPKMALAIVSGMTISEFQQVIHAGDITALSRIPGVGKKTAERLIIELRDRLPKPTTEAIGANTSTYETSPVIAAQNAQDEAMNALLALGYKQNQAEKMVARYKGQDLSVEEIIRLSLKASLG